MTCIHINENNIDIVEGTTRHLYVTVRDQNGNPEDLTGYEAYFVMKMYEKEIVRKCDIIENEISTIIQPSDTIDVNQMRYEIRILKDKEIYEIIRGKINRKEINLSIFKCSGSDALKWIFLLCDVARKGARLWRLHRSMQQRMNVINMEQN